MKILLNNINSENLKLDLDKITLNKISAIKKIHVKEKLVYDLEVDESLSYGNNSMIFHNGGGKRKGSLATYIEPWHADIFDFLELRKNNGKEELRARDLNLAIWLNDLFMVRVEQDGDWTLMDPNKCKGLFNVYGKDFEDLYTRYESEHKGEKVVKAREVWSAILSSQIETGQPYLTCKDAGNFKSNQKNVGVIKSSNLCAEIFEYSDDKETATCTLASISLPACVEGKSKKKKIFNFEKLEQVVRILTINLNKIIDIQYYPTLEAKLSATKNRPIGIGIQGLADVFCLMRYTWDSESAKELNRQIAETIYYTALKTSCELAKVQGPYSSFKGSPASQGILQFDMWNVKPSDRYNWDELKNNIILYGMTNSLHVAQMPTASTSQILGNVECFEPFTSNIYKRATLSGDFIQVNKYLVNDLLELGLWNDDMRQEIIAREGSIQDIKNIPQDIKDLYKTVWEIKQKDLIDLSVGRGPFVCQSQSLNLYFKEPNYAKLTSAFFYGWKAGLKTLVYYTRTQGASSATKFTISQDIQNKIDNEKEQDNLSCSLDNKEDCIACSA